MRIALLTILAILSFLYVTYGVASYIDLGVVSVAAFEDWPAPGSEDTELRCLMEREADHGETEVYAGVQA